MKRRLLSFFLLLIMLLSAMPTAVFATDDSELEAVVSAVEDAAVPEESTVEEPAPSEKLVPAEDPAPVEEEPEPLTSEETTMPGQEVTPPAEPTVTPTAAPDPSSPPTLTEEPMPSLLPTPTLTPVSTPVPTVSPVPTASSTSDDKVNKDEEDDEDKEDEKKEDKDKEDEKKEDENSEDDSYARYQGPATYSVEGIGGVGKAYIQSILIRMLYGGAGGMIACDFDGYTSTPGRHEGIDFWGGNGSPVYSLTDGEVVRVAVGADGGALSTVAIYDPVNNKTVVYLHMAPSEVLYAGQKITRGTFIGLESTRGASAAHTHVEVVNGRSGYASLSVSDYTLENEDPYYYWAAILSSLDGADAVIYGDVSAELNGTRYRTVQEALDAAENGDVVMLLRDTEESVVISTEGVVLDLNGKTISAEKGSGVIAVVAPSVTIRNGKITGEDVRYALCVGRDVTQGIRGQYLDASGFTADNIEICEVTLVDQSECVIYIESQEESEEDITFQRVALRNNTGIVIAGCANKSHVVFDLCDIRGNRPKDPGKELIWFSNTDALIQNSLIQDNTSLTHGVIYASTGSNVEIDNSLISGNLSWIVGGLYVDGGVMQLRGVVVKENVGIYGAGGVQVNSGQFTVSGGAIYDNYLPDRPGLDVYLAENVNALIPSACNMKDSGRDFSESLWLGYYSGNMVDTAIYQPDGYVAVGIKTARPDTVDAVAASA